MNHAQKIRELSGTALPPSRWLPVEQGRIDRFAEVTEDTQWIHVDRERAAAESPFGSTVAHGMLTLSLVPRLVLELLGLLDAPLVINYGFNRVRFPAPLPPGNHIRLRLEVAGVEEVRGGVRATLPFTMEIQGGERPVAAGELLLQVGD